MELRQYQPSGICIGPMFADILMNGDDKNEVVMTGIGDRDFKWGDIKL